MKHIYRQEILEDFLFVIAICAYLLGKCYFIKCCQGKKKSSQIFGRQLLFT